MVRITSSLLHLCRLKWNGHSPTCLPQVLQVMEQSGELQRWEEKGEGDGGWVSWGLGAVSSPVKWVWQNYMSPGDRESYEMRYVDAGLIKVRLTNPLL